VALRKRRQRVGLKFKAEAEFEVPTSHVAVALGNADASAVEQAVFFNVFRDTLQIEVNQFELLARIDNIVDWMTEDTMRLMVKIGKSCKERLEGRGGK
jgi:hypothetical protein